MSAQSAGAYTATFLVMVNVMKGGERAPPTLTSLGKFYPHDGMYVRKQPLQLSVLCGHISAPLNPGLIEHENCNLCLFLLCAALTEASGAKWSILRRRELGPFLVTNGEHNTKA